MAYKIKTFVSAVGYNYTESPQYNPIRYALAHIDADGNIVQETNWFKCKDYFNDVVAAKNKTFFEKYGFDNSIPSCKDTDGAYVLVKDIQDIEIFKHNVGIAENKEHPVVISDTELPGHLLLFIPEYYFVNTYRISLLTFLIRSSNRGSKYEEFKSFLLSKDNGQEVDRMFDGSARKKIKSFMWDIPRGEEFWYYCTSQDNSQRKITDYYSAACIIHNNGVNSWFENVGE
tara:strand:- start:492 stop:1181 length:690 start_codon:yes stop_codon:yes gene_type:complete